MILNGKQKLHSRSGVAWLIGLAVLAVLILLVIVLIPTVQRYRYQAGEAGCIASLERPKRNAILRMAHDAGLSIRQLARLTGLGKTVVERALKV